jgi:hypothetical protein
MDLTEIGREGYFGQVRLKIGADGWLSSTGKRTSWFYTMRGISFLAKKPVAPWP